jgi:hypothetical protein
MVGAFSKSGLSTGADKERNRNDLLIHAYRRWFSPDGNMPDFEG